MSEKIIENKSGGGGCHPISSHKYLCVGEDFCFPSRNKERILEGDTNVFSIGF